MEITSQPAPRVARGVLGDGWVGRIAEAAEPWLLERLRVVARTPVEQVHLGWGGEAAREVVVSWCTPTTVPDPFVAVAGRIVPARSDPVPGGGWAHHAWLAPLDPAGTFTYAVGHAGRVRSRPSRFRTAPIGPAPFTFTASGDHGAGPAAGAPPTCTARRTVELVQELEPEFHLVAGAVPSANGDASVRHRWFRTIEPSARSRPWMACVGDNAGRLPVSRVGDPNAGRTFGTFRYAGVRFILLDSDDVSSEGTRLRGHTGGVQTRWLERTLEHTAADPAVEAIVVVMHQPPSARPPGTVPTPGVRDAWHGAFVHHGVSLVLQGRLAHLPERSHPLAGTAEEPVVADDGVTYVTCGGGEAAHAGVVRVRVEPATTDLPARLTISRHPIDGTGGPVGSVHGRAPAPSTRR